MAHHTRYALVELHHAPERGGGVDRMTHLITGSIIHITEEKRPLQEAIMNNCPDCPWMGDLSQSDHRRVFHCFHVTKRFLYLYDGETPFGSRVFNVAESDLLDARLKQGAAAVLDTYNIKSFLVDR